MEEKRKYTLAEIKAAFWAEFHKSGEIFFPYGEDEDSAQETTQSFWDDFVAYLDAARQAGEAG